MPRPPLAVNDPEPLLKVACAYHRAIRHLVPIQVETSDFALAWPTMALQAFVVELFFKALIAMEKHLVPMTHRYVELLAELSGSSQTMLNKAYTDRFASSRVVQALRDRRRTTEPWPGQEPFPETLGELLRSMNNSFEQLRYIFEGKMPSTSLHGELAYALLDVINTLDHEMLERCMSSRTGDLVAKPG